MRVIKILMSLNHATWIFDCNSIMHGKCTTCTFVTDLENLVRFFYFTKRNIWYISEIKTSKTA